MKYFAKVNDGVVLRVIVAEPEFFNSFVDDSAGEWIETKTDGSLRKNYAGAGYKYDSVRDAFIPPNPYPSWTLDEETCLFEPPSPMPINDNLYRWDEDTTSWVIDNE
jgi:hypothetical protein